MPAGHDADDETRDETSILSSVLSRGEDVVFIYRWLVSNYLRRLEAVVPNMHSV